MNTTGFWVQVTHTVKRITVWRSGRAVVQSHRGYTHLVGLTGQRENIAPKCFHQKARAARECGEAIGRRAVREAR